MKTTTRPWGSFTIIHEDVICKIKIITVNPNHRLSYQYHKLRNETWVMKEGLALITLNGVPNVYNPGETIIIPSYTLHRVENQTDDPIVFVEVQTGESFEEEDIVRIEDDYNRIN